MRTGDALFAIFAEGHEHVEALVTVVADKVISRHKAILAASGNGGEGFVLPIPDQGSQTYLVIK